MKNNKDYIIEKFHQVKALGFVGNDAKSGWWHIMQPT